MTPDSLDFKVNLTNCDREPIHILGNIQPFGFLVTVGADWLISRVSANVEQFTGRSVADLLGTPLADLFMPQALHNIRNRLLMLRGPDAVERLFAQDLIHDRPPFDLAVHFAGDAIVIEAEPCAEEAAEAASLVRTLIARLGQADSINGFIREGARQVRAITGFDRVMVYKFDNEGSGEVVAEALSGGVESFLGLHYPASDIPVQARQLYVRNIFRIIADVKAVPAPIVPQVAPDGTVLDQSLCVLRAVSPIHIEYLSNMGVSASLSISIIVDGKLWGLFACHHHSPRLPSLATRTAAELFGQMFSLMLESRERSETADYESRARAVTDRLMATIAKDADLLTNAEWLGEVIFDTIPADGVAVFVDGAMSSSGLTPSKDQLRAIVSMLNRAAASEVFASDSLQTLLPEAADYSDIAAGMIAIPISRRPRDYVVLFRSEQLRSVRWAGNPEKAIDYGPNGARLTPRKSFEAWSQLVKGRSLPFTHSERRVAEALRVAMLEVLVRLADNAGEERQRATERQELLIAELNHRVRNILALIRGLISQTRDGAQSVESFIGNLESRVQALARAHDLVTRDSWGPARIRDLIEVEAKAFLGQKVAHLKIEGENVLLHPAAFTTLALLFHELMTNAVKYGALSDSGTVELSWRQDEEGSLLIDWEESGGPPVTPPQRRGFGTTIIEKTVPHDLGGQAEIRYRLGGVCAHFCVPSRHVAGVAAEEARDISGLPVPEARRPLLGKTVLLVEDAMIIALDAEDALIGMGAQEVLIAANARNAIDLINQKRIDVALLDFNLGAENSGSVAAVLTERGVPFLFVTGYGSGLDTRRFPEVPVVTKPYGAPQIAAGLSRLPGWADQD
ncbi:HWE histidine kinase domain-containing protein [Sphingobium nicotianae]|uniref:histidine kinase n=1 Tax=Sphingobium nicotianae TaxID=2782607 RepID=A0A9X1IP53_9SPHN|nr:HWE histidine kinase domain-containing protein [Sphingobium nicotianae]MBT2185968.1 GAF domain-containing protein [Sphingobium nicotianae]